jgi:hypothetical protein
MKAQSTIILKITFFRQIRSLIFVLFFIGFLIVIFQFIDFAKLPERDLREKLIIFALFTFIFSLTALPILLLHIDYLIRNRNEAYEIRDKTIVRRKNGIETFYNSQDVVDIFLYHPKGEFSLPSKRLPWEHYHFVKIVMKSGEVLYLTSLLYPSGLEKILKKYIKLSYWSETRWFPTTLY